ncbi:MAG: ABC transporter ATP-binding protein [Candidatus Thermoplasmatota archaeon]|nr:ABC transporter ATP-binding protein [Candidatus Thermoplasmatota archaeon]
MGKCLEVKDLKWGFRNIPVLNGISFDADEGEIFGCLGRNGSGKSTIIDILSTLTTPTNGNARVCGYDTVKEAIEVRKRIGAVFENFYVPGDMAPLHYLYYYGELSALQRPVIIEREEALFETFDMVKYRHKKLSSLSEEVVRKVEICRALLSYPRVLLLDEPTRGLDIVEKKRIWAFLEGVSIEEGVTIFLTSHDLQEVSELCNEVAVISDGKIAFCGSPKDLAIEKGDFEKSLIALMMGQ